MQPVQPRADAAHAAVAAHAPVAAAAASARASVAVQRRAYIRTLHYAHECGSLLLKSNQRGLHPKVSAHLRPVHHRATSRLTTGTAAPAAAVSAARVATLPLRRRAHAGAL